MIHIDALGFNDEIQNTLIQLRRELHQYPELSCQEKQTTKRLLAAFKAMGIKAKKFSKTGVIATIKGTGESPYCVALRGDIDGLPIEEKTKLPYASKNKGLMHACGHDIHMAWIVGAAYLLAKNPAKGDVIIICQPAEEIGEGAKYVLNEIKDKKIDVIFGGHVDHRYEVGKIIAQDGYVSGSSDKFTIALIGKGGHAARPKDVQDPIEAICELVSLLKQCPMQKRIKEHPAVVSIGQIHAGSAPNIIPESAEINGTWRAQSEDIRQKIKTMIIDYTNKVAKKYKCQPSIQIKMGPPAIYNNAPYINMVKEVTKSIYGKQALAKLPEPNLGGEDFAYYLQKIPGCFVRIGARQKGQKVTAAHSSFFNVCEETIFVGAKLFAELAHVACQTRH